jgi:hypothetical protein
MSKTLKTTLSVLILSMTLLACQPLDQSQADAQYQTKIAEQAIKISELQAQNENLTHQNNLALEAQLIAEKTLNDTREQAQTAAAENTLQATELSAQVKGLSAQLDIAQQAFAHAQQALNEAEQTLATKDATVQLTIAAAHAQSEAEKQALQAQLSAAQTVAQKSETELAGIKAQLRILLGEPIIKAMNGVQGDC